MGTIKVSNRSESPGRHGGNYIIDNNVVKKTRRKRTVNGKTYEYEATLVETKDTKDPKFHTKDLGLHKSRKLSDEDSELRRKQIDNDIESSKSDIKIALEKIGQIKYYTES